MRYRHNTKQNQPIVNVTGNTPDAFLRARMLAQPVRIRNQQPAARETFSADVS